LGLLLVGVQGLAFLLPLTLMMIAPVAVGEYLGLAALGYILAVPAGIVWIWCGLRFLLPVTFDIALKGWKGILGTSYLTPQQVMQIVIDGRRVLWKDVEDLFGLKAKAIPQND
jgi:hypothetical protein